ncbi:MAG: hypothetical protein JWP91_802 [Fibrobacteres bacterium]|nr:hypothetical protein [Fibrobacterota bacterium]
MAIFGSAVYLSTILLEKNRWNGKGPSLLVSDWMEEAGEAGFAGLEIWMNHLLFSSRSEWELIKERSAEADLPVSLISATLPADGSDKSQRFRESVLEACDYFRPDGLKFSLADAKNTGLDSLEFVKEWSRDVPREISLLYDGGENAGPEALETARAALTGGRYQAVLHPFLFTPKELEAALDAAGDFVTNLGVQAKQGGQWILLEENADANLRIMAAARAKDFKGTWSLEFTKGAGIAGENIEKLFDNAEKDLNFIIEAQTRSAQGRSSKRK